MTSAFSTKQRTLTDNETRISLNGWVETLYFHISNEPKFARFLTDLKTWGLPNVEDRGFTSDANAVDGIKLTAANKVINLKVLLGFISIHAPVISSSFIKEETCSVEDIFHRLREYYDCRKTGGKITELLDFRLGSMESREALWERVYSFLEDNLVTKASGVEHKGKAVVTDEVLTPTLLNVAVIVWLDAVHRGLPALVKQRFAIPLRNTTIYSIRTEISDAIPSLLQELGERDGTISYSNTYKDRKGRQDKYKTRQKFKAKCCLCEAASRPGADTHFFQNCPFMPAGDRRFLKSKVGEVEVLPESESDLESDDHYQSFSKSVKVKPTKVKHQSSRINRVDVISSPNMEVEIGEGEADVTLDTGAESNLVKKSEARRLNLNIQPTTHKANMADGVSPMEVSGEVHFTAVRRCPVTKKMHTFQFDGLVVKDLNCAILGGMPFMDKNDIYLRPKVNSVYLGDCCDFKYVSIRRCANVRAATILRVPRQTCLLPGSSLELELPQEYHDEDLVSIEPRTLSRNTKWLKCNLLKPHQGTVAVKNDSDMPVLVKRHEQLCQVRPTTVMSTQPEADTPPSNTYTSDDSDRSAEVSVDPAGVLSKEEVRMFKETNQRYSHVFSPSLGCYNGKSGAFKHRINMSSSLPPQRRGRIPMYNRSNLEALQAKYDELHKQGVFIRPEDAEVTAEYVSPSFLVAKQSGGYRLVTAFSEIGQYAKPQPSVMPKVDDIIQHIAQYKWIVKADLTSAYYQIPLDKSSLKFVGVCTPFRGIYVYARAVMGLPGSESALEELLSRVLGDLMISGSVVKLADDLYIGAETPSELNTVWERVLKLLDFNNLRLSPSKTVCCPTSTEILGWQWKQGTLSATNHRLNTLAACEPPQTIRGLRSFIGSYKFLSRVIPRHSDMLTPLDKLCASGESKDKVTWTKDLEDVFNKAKDHLKQAKTLTLPRREDHLQIITDAATVSSGLASALYVIRGRKSHLAGMFNARKTTSQSGWLACELEALGIAAGVKHFSPYIVQSQHITEVLTDSRPCVQAYDKLQRGAFSASSRVSSFLATISRFHVKLLHISGKDNAISDYASRNAQACVCDGSCQICNFISDLEVSVVRELSVGDILSGHCPVPYTTRSTWLQAQQECIDLKHTYRLLRDGRVPSKKRKGITDVKRYLKCCRLSTSPVDGLIIVTHEEALKPTRQRIVVPRNLTEGLLTALHIQLNHPSKHQLKQIFNRGFYALDSDAAISRTIEGCHTCASLKSVPSEFKKQSTSAPPDKIGLWYAGDVVKRERQLIFLMRENVSSLTEGLIIPDEKAHSLRDSIVRSMARFRPPSGDAVTIRMDGASGFQSLKEDPILKSMRVNLEIGEAKNVNRNPIAERAVSEFHKELCKLKPVGGPISEAELAIILANMNSRIRQTGYSSTEIWTQRDMVSGENLAISDAKLAKQKYNQRINQHEPSARYKGRGHTEERKVETVVGDMVYLYSDRDKTMGRSKYVVTEVLDDQLCVVQKFTSNQFRGKKYKVRRSDLIKVLQHASLTNPVSDSDEYVDCLAYPHKVPADPESTEKESEDLESETSGEEDTSLTSSEIETVNAEQPTPNKRPKRIRKRPAHLADYVQLTSSSDEA